MNILRKGLGGFLFILITLQIQAQNSTTSYHKVIEWSEPISIFDNGKENTFLNFSNMEDVTPDKKISSYFCSLPLPEYIDTTSLSVTLINKNYIWPTPKEHVVFKSEIQNDSIIYNYSISQSKGVLYLDMNITPVFRPANAQSFQKLTSFDIKIQYTNQKESQYSIKTSSMEFAGSSVLNDGTWIKISTSTTGIYKITYDKLSDWGFSNPENIAIYGNGGAELPQNNSKDRDDDLVENAIWHHDNAIYFFSQGPVTYDYSSTYDMFLHDKNDYNDVSYYFITEQSDESKTVDNSTLQDDKNYNEETAYFNDYDYHEENERNLIQSGRKWFGEVFKTSKSSQDFDFNFPNLITNNPVKTYITLASNNTSSSETFSASIGDNSLGSVSFSVITSQYQAAKDGKISGSALADGDDLAVSISYSLNSSSDTAYLDYISINADRKLKMEDDELLFRNMDLVGSSNIVKYKLSDASEDIIVWDVTDPKVPLLVDTDFSNDTLSFIYDASELHEFVAFDPDGSYSSPTFVEDVENQNLHALSSCDFIIVCHPDFLEQANELADLHSTYLDQSCVVATTDQIYNEFSSGKVDPTAIRSFAKMFYDRADGDTELQPKNMLLFGDGSYDNRPDIDDNTNKIVTFESENSVHKTNSYVTDDYFGLLDDSEGSNLTSDKLDIGIGRFPVNTEDEADNAVDKVETYLTEQTLDDWKSQLTFIADDGNTDDSYTDTHMTQADSLTRMVDRNYPEFKIKKIYFDAYTKNIGATENQSTYPDVEDAIYDAVDDGTLIFNYTGHGSASQLANEAVLTNEDIDTWTNIDKLPIFVTATCEFSRFDDKDETSAGENIFLSSSGGGIALFSTTRVVYSSYNFAINKSFYKYVFTKNDDDEKLTFGEIIMNTKNNAGSSVNNLNFTLLGDPGLKLLYPTKNVNTLTINNTDISQPLDTIEALSTDTLTGNITNTDDEIQTDFNGEVYITIYDKKSDITTLDNNGAGSFSYESYDNVLFNGISTVTNGEFSCIFTVPKDIKYNFDNGKISYYAYSDDDDEAFGAFDDFIVGGINEDTSDDDEGPDIDIYLNNRTFTSGNKTTPTPLLIVDLSDETGINTSGIGIGHDITCTIDSNTSDKTILNDEFQADLDSYTSGSIEKTLSDLETGEHTLTIKAWDIYNNSSEESIDFYISESTSMSLSNPLVYPNPVQKGGTAYFSFNHDEPNVTMEITLSIYSLDGRLVDSQTNETVSLSDTISPIEWVASVERGIYIYKISVSTQTGRKGIISGKIIVSTK